MTDREPVPARVWIPAFEWLKEITPETTQWTPLRPRERENRYCRLCEMHISPGHNEAHAEIHRKELEAFRAVQAAQRREAAEERKRMLKALKQEAAGQQ